MINIDESGDTSMNESPELLQKFIEYIEKRKMVHLEDLSSEFHLTVT